MLTKLFRFRRRFGLYNVPLNRADWEHIEKTPGQEDGFVVKGTSKRVIVVKSPDPRIFEEAIFIVREDFGSSAGANASDVLRQAREVADQYIRGSASEARSFFTRIPRAVFVGAGALLASGAWLALRLLGVV